MTPIIRCSWCGDETLVATGVYLSQISKGRRLCTTCTRFTLHCECPKAGAPVPQNVETDVSLPLLHVPELLS